VTWLESLQGRRTIVAARTLATASEVGSRLFYCEPTNLLAKKDS